MGLTSELMDAVIEVKSSISRLISPVNPISPYVWIH